MTLPIAVERSVPRIQLVVAAKRMIPWMTPRPNSDVGRDTEQNMNDFLIHYTLFGRESQIYTSRGRGANKKSQFATRMALMWL